MQLYHCSTDKSALTDEFYEELHMFVGPQLTNIASDIAESLSKEPVSGLKSLLCAASGNSGASSLSTSSLVQASANADDNAQVTKYLFFNELNCQHNGTVHINQKLYNKQRSIPREVMNLLCDLYVQDANAPNASEVIMKTFNDYWIVKRSTNWRHSFIIFNKNSTLLDISEEANKLFDVHLSDVFNHV